MIGSHISDWIAPESLGEFNRLFHLGSQGKSKGEIYLKSNNILTPIYISFTSLQPQLNTVGIIITDFTEKRQTEKLIMDYQQDLEGKNHELTQINSELASFAYIASHDLQEPLRKIQIFATRIIETELDHLSENANDYFTRMQSAAKRMQSLIEDLLLYSRTNTMDRVFEPIDLNVLIDVVKSDLREELLQKKVTVHTSGLDVLNVIPFQFRQLTYNLISNSIKFSSPDHTPEISVTGCSLNEEAIEKEALNPEIKWYQLSVIDNGIGFDQIYSEKIFELFQRLHGKADYSGTGIGLAIVKKIVENHNGMIKASASKGTGARFDIYVPVDL